MDKSKKSPGQVGVIIDFKTHHLIRQREKGETQFALRIKNLEKIEVLHELVELDEVIKTTPTNTTALIRAKIVMDELEARSEFKLLKEISSEYRKKIAARIYENIQAITQS